MKKITLLLTLLLTASFYVHAEEITIGVVAPLTVVNADNGEDIVRTLAIVEDQLQTENFKNNYKFKIEDGKCGVGSDATTATRKLIDIDGVKYIIAGCSGETIQAGSLGQTRKIVVFGVMASDPAVRELGDYVFRTYVDIEKGVVDISKRILSDNKHRVAIFTEQVPFTQKIESLLLQNLGDNIVLREDFSANSNDFGALFLKARGLEVDAFYFNAATAKTASSLVNQAYSLKMKLPEYTYYTPSTKSFRDATGVRSNGIIYLDVPDIENDSGTYNEFLKLYKQKYSEEPTFEFLRRSTYDAARALILSIEKVGNDPTKVKDELNKIQFEGALGTVKFDEKGDIVGLKFILRQLIDGKEVVVK